MSTVTTAVLIPHYNNPQGLSHSLQSIKEEEALDVVIVDDGSREKCINEQLLKEEIPSFLKLHFIYLHKNSGIEHALNKGLEFILKKNYSYIARLDCGDTCTTGRFKLQKEYLKTKPAVGLVGSYARFVDDQGKLGFNLKPPVDYKHIKKKMYVNAMFIHPTIMFKREVIEKLGGYPTNYPAAEDFALFFKIIKQYKAENIPEFLVNCELNTGGISLTRRKIQLHTRLKILKEEFYWGFYPVYGLIRNYTIAHLPYSFIYKLKQWLR